MRIVQSSTAKLWCTAAAVCRISSSSGASAASISSSACRCHTLDLLSERLRSSWRGVRNSQAPATATSENCSRDLHLRRGYRGQRRRELCERLQARPLRARRQTARSAVPLGSAGKLNSSSSARRANFSNRRLRRKTGCQSAQDRLALRWPSGVRQVYAGKVLIGYTETTARELRERPDPLIRRTSPLNDRIK